MSEVCLDKSVFVSSTTKSDNETDDKLIRWRMQR
jgi:hypothetical protein